jgi:hypothetical protein
VFLNAVLPYFSERGIIGAESPNKLDTPSPPSGMVEDQETPAPVVPAYLRAGQVHGAEGLLAPGLVTEKRAGMRKFFKDALVIKELVLVRIDSHRGLFTGIVVIDQEAVIPEFFLDDMNVPEVFAAFPALEAFKGHGGSSR